LKSDLADKTVLLVTHSGVIQTLLCLSLGVELRRYWQFKALQASLTALNYYDKGAVLGLFNDCSHLKDLAE
jgi:broad specificity phosphatase PhoE